jgi:hypothetical protein
MGLGSQYLIVIVAASVVGLAELIARYRSNPAYVLRHSLAAWLYIALNGGAGAGALALIRAFGWFTSSPHSTLWRVLIAGFGAIAFFRSSLFKTKIGTADVDVGPSVVLGALLDACDRAVDRTSAAEISKCVSDANMQGLDPTQVLFTLPVLSLALMQNFSPSDQAQLGAELAKIREDKSLTDQTKMRAAVIQLAKYLGPALVKKVIADTGSILRAPAATVVAPLQMGDVIAAARSGTQPTPPATPTS